ncbi:MAG: wax ester/triacylglycerol synthase family O-acyltransferase [Actinobacteria bacterium]|nr:MAG: wax ester/triacylglycerol synthase family O-acyltransferase [Actinomycetota bacterium]
MPPRMGVVRTELRDALDDECHRDAMTRGRLSALDGSFLRLESPQAHMHVGWSAIFAAPEAGERPTIEALRERVSGRLDRVPWCRWRLREAPLGLTEPCWVEDRQFDLAAHVLAPYGPDDQVSHSAFAALRDELLSRPLDHARPLWQIVFVPRLEDGSVGMIGKVHHALVDGMAALQIVGLFSDELPDASSRDDPTPEPAAGEHLVTWALDSVTQTVSDGLGLVRAATGAATRPASSVRGALRGAGRVLRAVREDVLPPAPNSVLNVPIGSRRSLVGYHARRLEVRAARRAGGTINDIGLTVVAGALRALAVRQGEPPHSPLKVMVPVNMRRVGEAGPGNKIAMVNLELPIDLASRAERLDRVCAQTQRLKTSDRAQATEALYAASGLLPPPLRSPIVKAMASPRTFNLTISQSPVPRQFSMLGCEVEQVYSVVPIAEGHALAIGMIRFRQELFFGCYADPDAFPSVKDLPALLESEMRALGDMTPALAQRDCREPA